MGVKSTTQKAGTAGSKKAPVARKSESSGATGSDLAKQATKPQSENFSGPGITSVKEQRSNPPQSSDTASSATVLDQTESLSKELGRPISMGSKAEELSTEQRTRLENFIQRTRSEGMARAARERESSVSGGDDLHQRSDSEVGNNGNNVGSNKAEQIEDLRQSQQTESGERGTDEGRVTGTGRENQRGEVGETGGQNGEVSGQDREIPESEGKGEIEAPESVSIVPSDEEIPFEEIDYGDGDVRQVRTYTDDDGRVWREVIAGDNHWRQNTNARELAIENGPNHELTIAGPDGDIQIPVHGATEEELALIQERLEAIPPEFRGNIPEIVVAEDIGQFLNEDGSFAGIVAGFGGSQGVQIDRSQAGETGSLEHVLYHEIGHVQDRERDAEGALFSSSPPFGDGNAVSSYGNTNPLEDYAEAHREVFSQLARSGELAGTGDSILEMSPDVIVERFGESAGARYIQILENYGHEFPS